MCGIIGYVGKEQNASFVIDNLKKLEYRGYDSSGIANLSNGEFVLKKSVGNISNLEKCIDKNSKVNCAIAHTRWATHGKPTENNAHPHVSNSGKWAVVHNGIIENYLELKKELDTKTKFPSETDTFVIAEILDQHNVKTIEDFIKTCNKLKGSFALNCINADTPNTIFIAKRKSPLYCSFKNNEVLIASDPICFAGFFDKYFTLSDNQFAVATKNGIEFFDDKANKITLTETKLNEVFEESGKGNYPYFMLKEIDEEKTALQRIRKVYSSNTVLQKFDENFLKEFNCVEFIGCGTAYHAGLMGARYIEKSLRIQSKASIASEFIYSNPIISKKTLYVFVSQSGETADTLQAHELIKKHGATSIAVTNVSYSSLAQAVDFALPVCAGPEIAVASTKAYVCQLAVLYIFTKHLQNLNLKNKVDYLAEIELVENNILNFNRVQTNEIAEELKNQTNAIFIGKDLDYISALEGSLKLKEISYIFASSYPSGELKHGFLALVESGTIIFVLANNKNLNSKSYNAAHEAISRGAKAVLIGGDNNSELIKPAWHIKMPDVNEMLLSMLTIAPLQHIAYLVSIKKGINPDQPRNLAKSVTVE